MIYISPIIRIFVVIFSFPVSYNFSQVISNNKFLIPKIPISAKLNSNEDLRIYCYRGTKKHILQLWQTSYITINLNPSEYDLYVGSSPENVFDLYETERISWSNKLFSWKTHKIEVDSFNLNCIGILTSKDHVVELSVIRIDFWRIVRFGLGILLFLVAPNLSANPVFYYICGIALGVTSSIFIVFYLISRMLPRMPTLYAVLIGGWAVAVYMAQLLWDNLKVIIINYYSYVITYMIVTGLISFIVCYRFGPVTDPRSKNLIKWFLQVISLLLVFYSSQCQEASTLFIILLLVFYNFSSCWPSSFFKPWKKRATTNITYLTEKEYHEQGVRETVKALDDLRKYCSSNECNQWKTVLSLTQPKRFAQFMDGSCHLEDSEVLAYESESQKSSLMTDDSDSNED